MPVRGLQQGHNGVVRMMLAARADVEDRSNAVHGGVSALHVAARNNRDDAALQLTDAKGNPNTRMDDGTTPLMLACAHGQTPCVLVLLHAKADVDMKAKDGRTSLWLAVRFGHPAIVDLLIEQNVQKTKREWEELCELAKHHGHAVVERIIRKATECTRGPGRWLDDTSENTCRPASPPPFLPWPSKHSAPRRVAPFGDVLEAKSAQKTPLPQVGDEGYPSLVHDVFGNLREAEQEIDVSMWVEYTPAQAKAHQGILAEARDYTFERLLPSHKAKAAKKRNSFTFDPALQSIIAKAREEAEGHRDRASSPAKQHKWIMETLARQSHADGETL